MIEIDVDADQAEWISSCQLVTTFHSNSSVYITRKILCFLQCFLDLYWMKKEEKVKEWTGKTAQEAAEKLLGEKGEENKGKEKKGKRSNVRVMNEVVQSSRVKRFF